MVVHRNIILQSKIVHRSALFILLSLLASTNTACSYLGYGSEEYSCSGLPTGTRCMSAREVFLKRKELVNDSNTSLKDDSQTYVPSLSNPSTAPLLCNTSEINNAKCKEDKLNLLYLNANNSLYRLDNELLVQRDLLENVNKVEKYLQKEIAQLESIKQTDSSKLSNNIHDNLKENLNHIPLKKYQITFNSYVDKANVYHHKHDVVIFDIPIEASNLKSPTYTNNFSTHDRLFDKTKNNYNRNNLVLYTEYLDENDEKEIVEEYSSNSNIQYSDASSLEEDSHEHRNYEEENEDYANNDKLFSIDNLTDESASENINSGYEKSFESSIDNQKNSKVNSHTNDTTNRSDFKETTSFNPMSNTKQNYLNFNNNKFTSPLFNRTNNETN